MQGTTAPDQVLGAMELLVFPLLGAPRTACSQVLSKPERFEECNECNPRCLEHQAGISGYEARDLAATSLT